MWRDGDEVYKKRLEVWIEKEKDRDTMHGSELPTVPEKD